VTLDPPGGQHCTLLERQWSAGNIFAPLPFDGELGCDRSDDLAVAYGEHVIGEQVVVDDDRIDGPTESTRLIHHASGQAVRRSGLREAGSGVGYQADEQVRGHGHRRDLRGVGLVTRLAE